ncbi:SpoIIE family protein phosphatase [Streptacidiphilus sp. MAP12-16]|uniref:SpoIIE family protein phosphatase n=1 Tax=Streptacidiphilus sp. MAP12-16 TaxID=3156300 RepID=UPI003516A70C
MTGGTTATRAGLGPDGARRPRRDPGSTQTPADGAARERPPDPAGERDELLAHAVRKALKGTDAYSGMVYLRSRDRRSLVLSTVAGVPVSVLGSFRRLSVNSPLPAPLAYRSGRSVSLSGAEETMRRFPQLLVGLPYSFASAYAPIVAGEETFGVLCALWPASAAGVPTGARRHLRTTANRLGGALGALVARGAPVESVGEMAVIELPTASGPGTRVGLFDWNLATGEVWADEVVCAIFGLDPDRFDGRAESVAASIHPDDLPQLRAAARRALVNGQVLAHRLRVVTGVNRARAVELWGRVPDAAVGSGRSHLVGAVLDTGTGAAAAEAVERLRHGIFSLDPDGRVTYANLSTELLLGSHREELLGRHLWESLEWLSDPGYEDRYRAAMISRQPTAFLACRPPDRWMAFALHPDAHGVTGTVVPSTQPAEGAGTGPPVAAPSPVPATIVGQTPAPARASLGAIYHLVQLASALTQAVTVREVCATVAEEILPAFGGQELAIYVIEDNRLNLALQVGYPDGFLDRFEGVPMRARLPGVETLSIGAPIFFESVDELSSAYPGIALDEMCAWAFLPLIASGHPVGSCILGFDESHPFTPDERGVLTALGGLIAQALERARLYDAEFALARGLQHALLPHRLPEVPGVTIAARYLPGTQGMEIGGDWYDAIVTARGLCLVIGDVEGHSVAAAATMGQLRSAVRAFATSGNQPNEVLARTNELLPDLGPGLLASCCLIEVDPATGWARGVRAGHLPPLLRHADGRTEVLDVPGGVLLGVDPLAEYPIGELLLPPGSLLALYTDGLVEEPGMQIDQGIDLLRVALAHADATSLEQLADRLLGHARRSTTRADDVALLLTQFAAEP